ncbi:MAG: cyclodeaminase/cyclohydrolase family protein [Candidatus Omnitrophica bacterium]|nr:cyclodeaminase/cyclohydrolase family protein [Candidatus Omnitrophota bacterium]
MKYADIAIKSYLDELAARKPSPGGGSAAALFAAIGCALMEMVLNYSDGKNTLIKKARQRFKAGRTAFVKLIDDDIAAYKKYSFERNQKNLKEAASVPLKICLLSYELTEQSLKLLKVVNKNLISDAGCAVYGLVSSFKTARVSVDINMKYMEDKRFAVAVAAKLNKLEKKLLSLEKGVICSVNKIIKKPWQKY